MSDSERPPGDPGRWPGWGVASLLLLLFVYLALAVGSARQKSVTVDELGHLPSGVYFLTTGDARYATLNPPLVNALSALPVLALDLEADLAPPPPSDDVFSFWSNGFHFQEAQRADYLRIFDAARWVPILAVAALAVLLFAWGRRMAPQAPDLAGLLAAGFVCLSPNVLAQARLVGTDTGTACFVTLAIWSLSRMLRAPRMGNTLLCGVALGLAQLSKFYALLLYPVFLGVGLGWQLLSPAPRPALRPTLLRLAGVAAISLLVWNSGYLWQEVGLRLDDLALQSELLREWQGSMLGRLPLPIPAAYLRAFDGQLVESSSAIPSFLFGERFVGGRWNYYLLLMAVKTPLALCFAFGLGAFLALTRPKLSAREALLLLSYPVLLFVLLSASDGRQLGVRALLSAVPLVWLSVAVTVARSGPLRWPAFAAAAALLLTLLTSLGAYPDYLAYFNLPAGGRDQGHRYASEANVDAGQDLVGLAAFLEAQESDRLQLLYFGSVDPALYGLDFSVPSDAFQPGWLAVSVSLYHMRYPMYDHGVARAVGPVDASALGEPVARIGGSIHVFRIEAR